MSTGNWLAGVGGGAASGAALGSYFPGYGTAIGAVAGGILGAFGASEADKNDKRQEEWERNQDPTTPYRVRLPSGAVITMYAHGKPGARPTPRNSAQSVLTGLNTAAALAAMNGGKGAAGIGQEVPSGQQGAPPVGQSGESTIDRDILNGEQFASSYSPQLSYKGEVGSRYTSPDEISSDYSAPSGSYAGGGGLFDWLNNFDFSSGAPDMTKSPGLTYKPTIKPLSLIDFDTFFNSK